jgi:hypothetical protein
MLTLTAALTVAPAVLAAPAQAEPAADAFLAALTDAGLSTADPAGAVMLGQSVCPMLAEPGQTAADAAAKVADTAGMPLGAATMFTGLAISMFCPAMVARLGTGSVPQIPGLPLGLPGF